MIKVSVIVPTYNREQMIVATLRSLAAQSYPNMEVIVVDDGSTDATEEVVSAIIKASAIPIRYLKKENGGCSSARNAGIGIATGSCLAFLDSDDQYTPSAIESLVTALNGSGADFVYSPSIEVSPAGEENPGVVAAPGAPERFAREHFLTLGARNSSILYRRKIFDSFRFEERERYNEDSDFLQKVAINFKAAYCPVPTVKVFHHDSNKSANAVELYRAVLRSYERILQAYPAFADSVADVAPARLDRIRFILAEALVAEADFTAAQDVYGRMCNKPLRIALCVMLQSAVPLAVCRVLGSIVRSGVRSLHDFGGCGTPERS